MSQKPKRLTRAERRLAEADVQAEHKPKPATNAERRWYEHNLGQQRLPGFADGFTPPPRLRRNTRRDHAHSGTINRRRRDRPRS